MNYIPGAKFADNAVDNGDVLALDVVDHHLAHARLLQEVPIPQE